jgi:hypothetical protein
MDIWVERPIRVWLDWTNFRGEEARTIKVAGAVTAAGARTAAGGAAALRATAGDDLDDAIPF